MRIPTKTIVIVLVVAYASLWQQANADGHDTILSKQEFDACVRRCGNQYENCSKAIHSLWLNFRRNRQRIMDEMVKCCLAGELDHTQPPTLSFATCVRDNCHAEMWGCNIKKRHSGFLSEDEKLGILERENKDKKMRNARSSRPLLKLN
ncbi:hypothetical protein FBUS_06364 [Fasciolopsis buskii]|uniref:Uncharacterized protein n=1 Tax=Fasciolopsis buskii TaxID=27845 RepID=A0A8E0SAJ9_9TREM|nr:hypothetical protein FBUS_06364 [Fasciolopsis buski]